MTTHDLTALPAELHPDLSQPLTVDAALAHVAGRAFAPTPAGPGRVGLELELHLVDLALPGRRPTWEEVRRVVVEVGLLPMASRLTVEPGGQLELSTDVHPDVVHAVAALGVDLGELRTRVAGHGLGLAALGTDPARPPGRINPAARYAAMERHFDALGCVGAGRSMMTGTAALQVNLDAGPREQWGERMAHLCRLVPVLVAISSTSPWLGGGSTGWHSMRQGVWQGIDPGRTALCPTGLTAGDPGEAWAAYALDAPVMLLPHDGEVHAVTRRVTFREWLEGSGGLPRAPRLADLDEHLTTLFPPVRPRGYLELRAMDAMPDRWWPAMAAVAVALAEAPAALDVVAEVCEPLAGAAGWQRAAQHGLADTHVRRAVLACLEVARAHVAPELAREVDALAALLESGRSPAAQVARHVEHLGPVGALLEAARD
ncbi:glutamate-cysteine ligase family protein [Nocardioides marmoraquaticus]